jgi:hypothetical protein
MTKRLTHLPSRSKHVHGTSMISKQENLNRLKKLVDHDGELGLLCGYILGYVCGKFSFRA